MPTIARPREPITTPVNVSVRHDGRAGVWYVDQSDLPGLHAEASTLDELVEIIGDLAPDLVANLPAAANERVSAVPICIRRVVQAKRADAA